MGAADSVSSSSLLPTLELPRPHDPLADVSNDLNHNGKDFEMAEPAERRTASRSAAAPAQTSKHNCVAHSKSRKKKHKERERKEEQQQVHEKPNCELKKGGSKMIPSQDSAGEDGTQEGS